MSAFRITIERHGDMTAQSAFALNLAALITHAGGTVSVEQESGKTTSAEGLKVFLPATPSTPSRVTITINGQ